MKRNVSKKKAFISSFIIFLGAIGSYLGYFSKTMCKPSHAGFWYVFVVGMSVGVMITLFAFWMDERKNSKKDTSEKGTMA